MTEPEQVSSRTRRIVTFLTVFSFVAVSAAVITIVALAPDSKSNVEKPPTKQVFQWDCIDNTCRKVPITNATEGEPQSLAVCKMFCVEFGNMWPRPTEITLTKRLDHMNTKNIDVRFVKGSGLALDMAKAAFGRFTTHVEMIPPVNTKIEKGGKPLLVSINIRDMDVVDLDLETDESYTLQIFRSTDNSVKAEIVANTFFGARHGLETLEQFIVYDDINSKIWITSSLEIKDKPVYPYRGLLLDTARNFYTVEAIKRTLDAMGACKLNRFHWHITDTHSFSFQSKSYPEFTRLGSITPSKVYTIDDIKEIVQHGIERGVKIIPEFDAPAHVGEGWQNTDFTVCFKATPWENYCLEPPCGQFDPTKEKLYDVLEGIYSDMFELFKPDIFHMGGDEVKYECWNETASITDWMKNKTWDSDEEGFLKLWDHFQKNAQNRAYKVNGKKLPIILWTSSLAQSDHIDKYLNKDDYIIQVWTKGSDPEISKLLDKGYKLIISNYDALYLDCGFSAWVGEGHNWCSPYKGWQTIYNNNLAAMGGAKKELILGGEATLWSEQADSNSIDGRLWPRAGALAERLWSEPKTTWEAAEKRFLHFRKRLVDMGVAADALQPEWCYQNEGECYL